MGFDRSERAAEGGYFLQLIARSYRAFFTSPVCSEPVHVVSAGQLPGLRSLRTVAAGQMGRAAFGFKRVMYTAAAVLLFAGLFLAAPDDDPDGEVLLWDAELLERKR
ncbi:hypothetical protein D3C74_269390 [compost metagenome]